MKIYKKKIFSFNKEIKEIDEKDFIEETKESFKDPLSALQALKEGMTVKSSYAFYSIHKNALERI